MPINAQSVTIKTNHHRRDIIYGFQLTPEERDKFDYIDWNSVDHGGTNPEFVMFKGELYDINDVDGVASQNLFPGWHNYKSDSFFSGLVFRYPVDEDYPTTRDGDTRYDFERIIVGTYYAR